MTMVLRAFAIVGAGLFTAGASCLQPAEPDAGVFDSGRPSLGDDCGDLASDGNGIGIGKYCRSTNDCPISDEGTTIQCSTVLTDDSLPLLCSRICGETDGGAIDCGAGAGCMNIIQLGYDLNVCVPYTCDALFDGGVVRDN